MEAAVAREKQKLSDIRKSNTEELITIKTEIEEAEASGQIPSGLTRKLRTLEKREQTLGKELQQIRLAPTLLTVKGGLLPTTILLVTAVIFSAVAWQLSSITTPAAIIWIVGLIAMGIGIFRIYKTMNIVESVAVTSDKVALRQTIDAFKLAQTELENSKKPVVAFSFRDTQPPFKMKAESELPIRFMINVNYGEKISGATVYLLAPKDFKFLDCESALPTLGLEALRPVAAVIRFGDITGGTYRIGEFKLKAPFEAGNYTLTCDLIYEGGRESTEYEVEVVGET